jgi:hypothetical protein
MVQQKIRKTKETFSASWEYALRERYFSVHNRTNKSTCLKYSSLLSNSVADPDLGTGIGKKKYPDPG